ncbi:DUF3320 domain-containing protein [Engelhardtia mirabilis]|uniref:DUF3320 domain-containing protein n=1 Tax=Engelhardtia mirabilis TaxID=2528011 RepID=UPI003AF3A408
MRPPPAPVVRVELTVAPRVHFALEQNGMPLVRRLRIEHLGERALHDVVATVTLGGERAEPLELRLDRLDPGGVWEVDDLALRLDPERLRAQEEREITELQVQVQARRGVVGGAGARVEILAWNEWPGLGFAPELTAAFVLPNHPSLDVVLTRAAEHLSAATGSPSLDGYQSAGRQLAIVAAVWAALAERGIVYAEPPASFERDGQKVRLPHRVLSGGLGTCLDLSLLAAAALEQAGLHPLVVFLRGHALVGVWMGDESFPEAVVEDPLRLRKRVQIGAIAVLEATGLAQRPASTLAQAREAAGRRLDDLESFECVIDVRAARRVGIRPLATRITDEGEVPEVGDPVRIAMEAELSTAVRPLAAAPALSRPIEAPTTQEPQASADRRLASWKRRLLDLSLRNRLLNFRESKRTVPLTCADVAGLEGALARGGSFALLAADDHARTPSSSSGAAGEAHRAYLAEELAAGRLRVPLGADELEKRLREVHRGARLALEESGAGTLYLALGFLEWRDAAAPERLLRAPLLLLPMELERLPLGRGWRLRGADEEPRINDSLLEKLAADFGLDPAPLARLTEDDAGLDVPAVLKRWRETILDRDGWDLVEEAWVGLFSFAKLVMWRDLEARRDELLESRSVRFLVERPDEAFDDGSAFPSPRQFDANQPLEDLFLPLDSDSSQMTAVLAAAQGRTFVLEGPPGTGKSQTITNLIANALGQGKRVLFVAEKRAALEVVRRRLEAIGLGPFCLELHSNKIAKREVVAQLGRALDAAAAAGIDPRAALATPLARVRDELASHADALHGRGPLGRSLFEVLGRLLALDEAPRVAIRLSDPAALGAEQLRDLVARAEDLARAADLAEPGADHPLDAIHRTELGPAARAEVESACAHLRGPLAELCAAAREPLQALGLWTDHGPGPQPFDPSGAQIAAALELAELLAAGPDPGAALLSEPGWEAAAARLTDAIGRAEQALARRASLLARWDERLLERDTAALLDRVEAIGRRSVLTRWWVARGLRAELRPLRRASEVPGLVELAGELREARALLTEEAELARTEAARLLGTGWNRDGEALRLARSRVERAGRLRAMLAALGGADVERTARLRTRWCELGGPQRDLLAPGEPLAIAFTNLAQRRAAFETPWAALARLLAIDAAAVRGTRDELPLGLGVDRLLDALRDAGARLRDWCLWQAARAAARPTVLAPIVEALDRGQLDPVQTPGACERSLLEAWTIAKVEADDGLRRFHGVEHGGRVARFERLDRDWLIATRQALAAQLAAAIPSAGDATSPNSEVGILQRELRKKRGHLPVRRLVERLPRLLPQLAPCVLASPLSTAQFLDAGLARFDLVVFDEASQIPVWDGVGAMARGLAAVVVGDSKQLPPTSFFSVGDDDEFDADPDYEELESLLDECVAARLPRLRLGWHYRSRHESLIAFSNARYYEGSLETFPAPGGTRAGLGLRWHHVAAGVYDRAGTRTNRIEAEALVARTVELLEASDPASDSAPSVGIVVFSLPQQHLVEELLEVARDGRADLDPWFDTARLEPVLVKNLENVQGDERDVILLGVGYGPDPTGRMSMNLGPLNRAGGERRLNVAITRARRALEVFSSFSPERIDLRRTGAAGVRDLKSYLEFASGGQLPHGNVEGNTVPTDGVAERLAAALRARGHRVAQRVGCSTFRVDLAVASPEDAERYDLGLLLDGAGYASGATVRDRDRLRGQVLAALGWNLERAWSLDVWTDLAGLVDRLESRLESLRAAPRIDPEVVEGMEPDQVREAEASTGDSPEREDDGNFSVDANDDTTRIRSAPPAGPVPELAPEEPKPAPGAGTAAIGDYVPAKLRSRVSRSEHFYAASEVPRLAEALGQVLEAEAPVHFELAARRVATAWGVKRVTRRVLEHLTGALAALPRTPVELHGFLWTDVDAPAEWTGFRGSPPGSAAREADELPLEEVACAAAHALAQNVSLPVSDLLRETAQLFGFTRLGSVVEARMLAGVELLESRAGCRLEDGRAYLPD